MHPIFSLAFEGAFWASLSTRSKIAYVSGGLILGIAFGWMGRHLDRQAEADVLLRNACESAPMFASPASLYEHFPEDTYSGRCLPELSPCGSFTSADAQLLHYPCPDGHCTMYWQFDGESCRVHLSDGEPRAQGAPEFKTLKGRWKSLP